MKRLISRPVNSILELWTPTQNLASILRILHNQHQESFPYLLHSPSSYAFPLQCYPRCRKKKTNPPDLSVRFLFTLGSSCRSRLHFHFPKIVQIPHKDVQTTITVLGLRKRYRGQQGCRHSDHSSRLKKTLQRPRIAFTHNNYKLLSIA